MKIYTFSELLEITKDENKHLLLGNGFSQGCFHDIFSYGSLLDKSNFNRSSSGAKKAFKILDTTDFESVIQALQNAAKLIMLYGKSNSKLASQLENDATSIKNVLVDTITKNHPTNPSAITKKQYDSCIMFLKNFNKIYSLNYDLLLYWVLMHSNSDESKTPLRCDDGFRHPEEDGEGPDYVTWEIENTWNQNINYLHGALHLFDSGSELKKFTWIRTGISLITQIKDALGHEMYPLIVAEGTSKQKKEKLMKSAYLLRGLKSIASIKGALFTYGFSMSDNDDHVLKIIQKSKICKLCVSIYGDIKSKQNKAIILQAAEIAEARTKSQPLELLFYDAKTANVWDNNI